jgi:hypothetical protein
MSQALRAGAIVAACACASLPLVAEAEPPKVKVGSKAFTEGVVLGELATRMCAAGGAEVDHRRQLGGSVILFKALEAGEIDVYVEYTGTLAAELLHLARRARSRGDAARLVRPRARDERAARLRQHLRARRVRGPRREEGARDGDPARDAPRPGVRDLPRAHGANRRLARPAAEVWPRALGAAPDGPRRRLQGPRRAADRRDGSLHDRRGDRLAGAHGAGGRSGLLPFVPSRDRPPRRARERGAGMRHAAAPARGGRSPPRRCAR